MPAGPADIMVNHSFASACEKGGIASAVLAETGEFEE